MRQVIRFHCRISHVAAHTAVFNVNVTFTLEHMMEVVEKVTANPQDGSLLHPTQQQQQQQQQQQRMANVKSYLMEALPSLMTTTTRVHKDRMLRRVTDKDMEALENTLQEELDTTNGLKKWPCQSFWDIRNIEMDDTLRKMASNLSPDCDAPFTKCVVARDRCEMNGHASC
jgi:hypothetical protein